MIHLQLLAFTYGTFSAFPQQIPVDSRLECLFLCYYQANCSSFFYFGGSCFPMQHVYAVVEQSVSSGLEYFVWKSDQCQQGYIWYRSLGRCYKLYQTEETWQSSEDQCQADGGHLITVDSSQLNEWMNLIVTTLGKSVWTGGRIISNVWVWADNSPIVSNFWGPDQPENEVDQNCMLVYESSGGIDTKLHDARCNRQSYYVCQKIESHQQPQC